MPSLSTVRTANAALTRAYRPVALFLGGTSGIGEGMARAFTQHAKGDADIFIIGRNRAAGEAILNSLPAPAEPGSSAPRREFVQCDATLMKNVRKAAEEIRGKVDKINYIVMSPGVMTLNGRDETEEGIDKKLAVHYYARWTFLYELSPLLQKAKEAGQDAKTMTILAAGIGGKMDKNDLGMKKNFSITSAGLVAPTYNDCMVESFATRYPAVSFTHSAPGLVRTNLASSSDSGTMRLFAPLMNVMTFVAGVSPADCAEYLLNGLYNAPAGVMRLTNEGNDLKGKRIYHSAEERDALWEHTVKETGVEA